MERDASVTRVDELRFFATYLQDFCSSIVANANAYVNMMQLKQDELQHKVEEAEHIVEQLRQAENELNNSIADCKDSDTRAQLITASQEANNKRLEAQSLLGDLRHDLHIVKGNVYEIIQETRRMRQEVEQRIDAGRVFLRNVTNHLENYTDRTKKNDL